MDANNLSKNHVLQVRRKARNKIFRDKNRCTGSKQFSFKVEKDIAITVFLMIGCFLLSWTPYALVSIISALGKPNSISTLGTTLPAIFAKCSTLWNPVIYVIRNGEFRRSLFATLSGMPCNRKFANTSMHPCSNNSTHDAPVKSSNRGFLAMTELKSENSEHHTVFFTCIAEPAEVPSVRTTSISEDVQVETDDVTEEMRVELVTTAVQTSSSLQFISATVT
ncbi:hypothetical protein ACJMK2_013218 [Sinanodonta woodiana]|uniref:G-protein coupled receptors family 1 profile domain-containing protein n=1 Tax=Sinanodonta woodiana TaxID=1069815 RepID=A0ABD3UWS8_SINWO